MSLESSRLFYHMIIIFRHLLPCANHMLVGLKRVSSTLSSLKTKYMKTHVYAPLLKFYTFTTRAS